MAETRRVLVVDDDPDHLKLVEEHYLRHTGYEITPVNNLDDAVVAAHANPHLIVLLDLRLPPYTGLETLRTFMEQTERDAPVIIATGSDVADLEVEAISLGADSAIGKTGLTPGKLQHAIRCAIRRSDYAATRDRAAELLSASLSVSTSILTQIQAVDDRLVALEAAQPTPVPGVIEFFRKLSTSEGQKLAGKLLVSLLRWVLLAVGAGAAGGGVMSQLGGGG